MNTLKLYSMLKVNQKKAKETKYNHTRIILAISATIIAILCMASCATDKSKYHFDSSKDALTSYHVYLSELQKKESLSSDDFVATISNWSELRDSVYTYISKDSAFYAHTYLSSEFYSLHDSIRTEMFRLAVGQDRTLKDVLRVKKSTSQYNNEEDIKTTFNSAKAFYASLDSLEVFKADKGQTLVLYRKFFSGINDIEFKKLNDLKSVIRTEDRLFRTFLTHINEYSDISLLILPKVQNNYVSLSMDMLLMENLMLRMLWYICLCARTDVWCRTPNLVLKASSAETSLRTSSRKLITGCSFSLT